LNLLPSSHLVSTHIRGLGHALFHVRENGLEFRSRSGEDRPVDKTWINKTGLVAEGLASQPYLHLDIRTPFGETVGDHQVQDAVAESLGPRRDRFHIAGWHIQFVEDTNLGSNHRVFVDLSDAASPSNGLDGMDSGLSLELAIEALGELVASEKGETSFQLLFGTNLFCYSLLYLNGSPFHVLRVGEGAGPKAAAQLRRHREFATGLGRTAGAALKTYLAKGDPLWDGAAVKELRAEPLEFARALGDVKGSASGLSADPDGKDGRHAWLLHLGLAQAARQKDFAAHNRVGPDQRRRNESIRTRFRFILAMAATTVCCLLVAGVYWISSRVTQSQLAALKAQASVYQSQVDSIRSLRMKKRSLEASLADLRPIWHQPMDWSQVMGSIAASLPEEAGIDGLTVSRKPDGSLEMSFRAWVRDWNQVQAIQKKLADGKHFSGISLSEQRKDLTTGVVIFHVTGKVERQ
jgi:Tfp pilus assembly protein PilN